MFPQSLNRLQKGHVSCFIPAVVFNKKHTRTSSSSLGFPLVEAVVAIALVGIGIATTVGALTKFNQFASTSRNSTGAYTMATKKIDAILSEGPFNPQKKNEDGTA